MKKVLLLTALLGMMSNVYAGAEPGRAWNLYLDADYGFTLEYPASWTVEVLLVNENKPETVVKKKLAFRGPDETTIILDLWTNDVNQDVVTWVARTQTGLLSKDCTIPEAANATVDGESALSLYNPQHQSSDQRLTYFRSGNLLVKVEYRVTDADQALPVYQHLLSSFTRTMPVKEQRHE